MGYYDNHYESGLGEYEPDEEEEREFSIISGKLGAELKPVKMIPVYAENGSVSHWKYRISSLGSASKFKRPRDAMKVIQRTKGLSSNESYVIFNPA